MKGLLFSILLTLPLFGIAQKVQKSSMPKYYGVGDTLPNFSQPDTLGNIVSLNNFKGNYVLVEFWASWCAACKRENINLVRQHNLYKDKNFTILSVSLDEDAVRWKHFIKLDSLAWHHVSDLRGWNNRVALQFNIRSLPQNFLLSPDGKIIARNLKKEDLNSRLAEIFKDN